MKKIILGFALIMSSCASTQFQAHGVHSTDRNSVRAPSQSSTSTPIRLHESIYNPVGRKLCAWKVTYKDNSTFIVSPVANQLYVGSTCSSGGAHEFNCANNICTSKYNGYLDMGTIELISENSFTQTVRKDTVVYELGSK